MDYYSSLNAATLDPDIPTVFEILSAKQLQDLIYPSIRHIIVHYAECNPAYLLRIANRFDEIYLVAMGLVEHYHLKHWNATFTEKFYGLKRTNILGYSALNSRKATPNIVEKERRLTAKQRWLCLFFVVVVPYLREKCEARYDILKGKYSFKSIEEDRPADDAPLRAKIRYHYDYLLYKWYPRYCMVESTSTILFLLGYLFHRTKATSLVDYLVNFQYSRLSSFDHQLNSLDTEVKDWREYLTTQYLSGLVLSTFSYALPSALFFVKFFEWWNSSNFASKLNQLGPKLDPPSTGIPPLGLKGCPICKRTEIENPAVLETGVIYCYKCIFNHLQSGDRSKKPVCPATNKRLLLTTWNDEQENWLVGGLRRLMI